MRDLSFQSEECRTWMDSRLSQNFLHNSRIWSLYLFQHCNHLAPLPQSLSKVHLKTFAFIQDHFSFTFTLWTLPCFQFDGTNPSAGFWCAKRMTYNSIWLEICSWLNNLYIQTVCLNHSSLFTQELSKSLKDSLREIE